MAVPSMTTAVNRPIAETGDIMSYVRVSILGRLVNEEVWSVNPVFDPTGEFPGGVNQAALDAAALAIANRSIPTGMRAYMSTVCTRTGARVEVRDDVTDGLIAISTQTSTTVTPGTGGIVMPVQSAAVLSLRTDTPGASGRGRLYWPVLAASLDTTTGRINAASLATFFSDFKLYLQGIRSDLATAFPPIAFDLAVRSKTTKTTPHVTRIQVGNVVDTQRRRRDALPENYLTTTFP